ncbi:MAG TPA: sterol desaturase family protein, partial [Leptospiraceae bacterium]|nr:sterol desaturase family protein [Leptospiraceae bacterium]
MEEWISNNSTAFRLSIFIGLFILFAVWEIVYPNHKPALERKYRWASNILLVVLNNALLRILFPITAIAFAETAVQNRWGFLNSLNLPAPASFILGILFLDFVIYLQHSVFHSLPLLWRLHRMHHADLELDVTSGTRFHPIEIIISMFIKIAAIAVSGVSPFTVLIFEVILNGMAMFNHSNIYIPEKADQIL